MSITARLQKVTQSLTPLQRAVLIMKALQEGRELDPDLSRIEDPVQHKAFNRYIALLWVANHYLAAAAAITAFRVDVAEAEQRRYEVLNEAAGFLDEDLGTPPSKGFRNWRERKTDVTVPEFLRSLALECRDDGAALTVHLWQELRALEQVWQDLASEYGGEDIVLAENREKADGAARRLRDCARAFGVRKLPDQPDTRFVEAWTTVVNDAFKHLGLMEPY
jgi:hypothetical protein